MARVLSALSNLHRLQLFIQLASCCAPHASFPAEEGPCACVGELAATTDISPSTVSHHLKELNNAGLIRMERRGQRVECRIDTGVLEDVIGFLGQCAGGVKGSQ